jgi:integrase
LLSVARRLLARLRSIEATAETENASAPDTNLPFLSYFDEWQAKTHLKGKTLDQAVSDIRQFNAAIPVSLEKLTGGAVQEWLETLLETASAATVRRKLSSLKSYWAWLKSHEYVSSENSPFSGRQIRDRRTKVEQALEKRQRFEPAEVTRLINAAANDPPLQNLIRLAAFTGARREGLASLKRDSVVKIDGVLSLRVQEKTLAGIREIPIHRKMAGLVSKLAKESKDGFLIPSEVNRYGQRGDSLGKRFTRLKANLGFGEHRTFHSLRHTVVYLFRKAECPTEIRNQILGHEDGNGGAGAGYGGHIDQKHKLEWLERAIRYPAA